MRVFVALLLLIAAVHADAQATADEVLKAFRAKQDLKPLAAKDKPDPWMVADELCARGAHDAAAAFAKAAPRTDTERLPEYVESQRKTPTEAKRREALAKGRSHLLAGRSAAALKALEAVGDEGSDATSIRLLSFRAFALESLGKHAQGIALQHEAAKRAERIGWLQRAVVALGNAGNAVQAHGAWRGPEALGIAREMLRLATRRGKPHDVALCHNWIGGVHRNDGDLEAAIRSYRKAEALLDARPVSQATLQNLYLLASALHDAGESARSIAAVRKALRLAERLGDAEQIATARGNLAAALYNSGDEKAAKEVAAATASASALVVVAAMREARGDLGGARQALEGALGLAMRTGSAADVALSHELLGKFHLRYGNHAVSLRHLDRALRLRVGQSDVLARARAQNDLGALHTARQDWAEARKFLEAARGLLEERNDKEGLAVLFINLSAVQAAVGEPDAALESAQRAIALAREADDRRVEAAALGNLGRVLSTARRLPEARKALEASLRLQRARKDPYATAQALFNLAIVLQEYGDYDAAIKSCDEARRTLERFGRPVLLANVLQKLGDAYKETGRYETALRCLQSALEITGKGEHRAAEAEVLLALSNLWLRTGRFDRAEAAITQARSIWQTRGDRAGEMDVLGHLASLQNARGDYRAAIAAYREYGALAAKLRRPASVANATHGQGIAMRGAGELAESMKLQHEALRLAVAGKMPVLEIAARVEIGNVHVDAGEYRQAIEILTTATRGARALGLRHRAARILGSIGIAQVNLGLIEDARRSYRKSLAEIERFGDRIGVVMGLQRLGSIHVHLGEYDQAMEFFRRGLAISRKARDEFMSGALLANIGGAHRGRGDLGRALDSLKQSREIAARRGDRRGTESVLGQLAAVYADLGEFQKAIDLLNRQLELSAELGFKDVTRALDLLAAMHGQRGDHAASLDTARRALALRESLGLDPWRTHGSLAATYVSLRRPKEAERHARAVLDHARKASDRVGVAYAHLNLGLAAEVRGNLEAALSHFRDARRAGRPLGLAHRQRLAEAEARMLLHLGRPADAIPLLEEVVAAVESRRFRARGVGDELHGRFTERLRESRPYERMAYAQQKLGRTAQALEYFERGRARAVLDLLARSRFDPMREAERRAREQGDVERVDALSRLRAKLVAMERDVRRLTYALSQRQVPEQRAALTKELTAARQARAEVLARRALLVRDLLPERAPASAARIRGLLRPDERLLFFWLGEKEVVVYLVKPEGVSAHRLAGTPAKLAANIDVFLRATRRRAGAARGVVRPAAGAPPARVGQRLLDALLPAHVRKQVARAKRIYIVPHGALHRLPFEALPRWLETLPPVAYVHSGSVLAWCRARRRAQEGAKLSVVAVGDPIYARGQATPKLPESGVLVVEGSGKLAAGDVLIGYDGAAVESATGLALSILKAEENETVTVRIWRAGRTLDVEVPGGPLGVEVAKKPLAEAWRRLREGELATLQRGGPLKPLPGTRREVKAIATAMAGTRMLLGEDATKARLFELAPQARFLHLATHQIVDETEFRGYSRLALTAPRIATPEDDGYLSLFELFEKWRDRLSGCELVVLSACETVKGPLQRDEGPYAMPLGFLYAGAPAVIGSLWRVDDESTAKLFARFYEELKAGKGKLEAFTAARKWLKEKYPDPYHWAPFVFIGDPR